MGFEPTEDVNPHALSRSATDTSALIVWGLQAGQPARRSAVITDDRGRMPPELPPGAARHSHAAGGQAAGIILNYLADYEGSTWQQRWDASPIGREVNASILGSNKIDNRFNEACVKHPSEHDQVPPDLQVPSEACRREDPDLRSAP